MLGDRSQIMKAVRVEKQGGPEVLELVDVEPIGAPGPGQAVVRVKAAGVNFMDVGQRRGSYPRQAPFTLGVEGAGVVESVGEGVRSVKPSDRVAFTGVPGAYSEAVLADAERLIPLPDEFTFEQGAAFPLQGMTAHYLINEFRRPSRQCCPDPSGCRRNGRAAGAVGQAPRRDRDRNSLD
jgi:NADPH2:quinone reductase